MVIYKYKREHKKKEKKKEKKEMFKIERNLQELGLNYGIQDICEDLQLYRVIVEGDKIIITVDATRKEYIVYNFVTNETKTYKSEKGVVNQIYKAYKIMKEEEKEMEKTIISKDNKEIRIISAIGEEVTPFELEVIEALNENYILDEIEANGEVEVLTTGDYIDLNGYEYLVFTDYEEAERLAVQYAEEIMQDCGLTDNLILEADLQGLINNQWFIDFWEEQHSYMAYEEGIEYIATEEELEQMEAGQLTAEEVRENYFNSLQDSIKGQEVEEFKFQFGDEYFHNLLIKENLIDTEALAKWCVEVDGVAHYLSCYDGEEISEGNLYLYRIS